MAKYIIDIPEDTTCLNVLRYEDGKCISARSYIIPELIPYVRSESYIDGLKKGQNEAWELALKLMEDVEDSHFQSGEMVDCFRKESARNVMMDGYQKAKSKYEAWKKQKDDNAIKQKVVDLAEEIGIHRLYAIVREIRGE